MRSLGQFAREEELETMLQEVDIDGTYTNSTHTLIMSIAFKKFS